MKTSSTTINPEFDAYCKGRTDGFKGDYNNPYSLDTDMDLWTAYEDGWHEEVGKEVYGECAK